MELKTFRTDDTFELMVLLYLNRRYPSSSDEKLVEQNNDEELSDEEYNDYFFEMVDDVREKFLTSDMDECIANSIVETHMSNGGLSKFRIE